MAITGQQNINIGLPNESAGSDSLYTAFTKIQTNFNTLFANSSPYDSFIAGNGISITANANIGAITLNANLIAGNNVTLSNVGGAIVIDAIGGNGTGGGTITSVFAGAGLNGGGNSGPVSLSLANSGVNAQSYINPTITVDNFGRITSASNNTVSGTVTSVGLVSGGTGISISGGPITSNGNITVTNTGVTRLNQGTGISLSGSNGNITISTVLTGTVTSVALTSSTLTITGNAITTSGSIGVNLGANVPVTGRLLLSGSEDVSNGASCNLNLTASYFSTSAAETATLAAGTEGLIKTFMMVADGGDMVITVTNAGWKSSGTGTMTFDTIGDSCTLQYINSKWFCIGNNGVVFA
jgi:hypothetical protein